MTTAKVQQQSEPTVASWRKGSLADIIQHTVTSTMKTNSMKAFSSTTLCNHCCIPRAARLRKTSGTRSPNDHDRSKYGQVATCMRKTTPKIGLKARVSTLTLMKVTSKSRTSMNNIHLSQPAGGAPHRQESKKERRQVPTKGGSGRILPTPGTLIVENSMKKKKAKYCTVKPPVPPPR